LPSDPADQWLSSYVFDLPEAFIAQRPVEPRHAARLLAVDPGERVGCRHLTVWDLQQELQAGDLLVVNNTRVLKARLQVRRASGGQVELLVLEPVTGSDWLCLARPAKRLKPGELLQLEHAGQPPIALEVIAVDAASECGGECVLQPVDLIVVAVKCLLAYVAIGTVEEGDKGRMRQFPLLASFIAERTEFHIGIMQLAEGERRGGRYLPLHRHQLLFLLRQSMFLRAQDSL